MKKTLTILALALIGLTSCEKSEVAPVEKPEFAVNPLRPLERRIIFKSQVLRYESSARVIPNPLTVPYQAPYSVNLGFNPTKDVTIMLKKGDKIWVYNLKLGVDRFLLVDTDINNTTGRAKGIRGAEYSEDIKNLGGELVTIR